MIDHFFGIQNKNSIEKLDKVPVVDPSQPWTRETEIYHGVTVELPFPMICLSGISIGRTQPNKPHNSIDMD